MDNPGEQHQEEDHHTTQLAAQEDQSVSLEEVSLEDVRRLAREEIMRRAEIRIGNFSKYIESLDRLTRQRILVQVKNAILRLKSQTFKKTDRAKSTPEELLRTFDNFLLMNGGGSFSESTKKKHKRTTKKGKGKNMQRGKFKKSTKKK